MSKEEIKELVEEYFSNPPENVPKWSFSEKWKTDVCNKVKDEVKINSTETDVRAITQSTHNAECENLKERLKKAVIKKFSNLEKLEIEDVVTKEWAKFLINNTSYHPAKGMNEFAALYGTIYKRLITAYNKNKREDKSNRQYEKTKETVLNPYDVLEEKEQQEKEKRKKKNTDITSYIQKLPDDVLKRLAPTLAVLRPDIIGKLFRLEESFLVHSFPSRDFLLKDIPEEFNFLQNIEDFRLDVVGYSRYERIVESQERRFMLLAIDELKKCRKEFEEKNKNLTTAEKEAAGKKYPLLSAVAVDKNGEMIKKTYKGELGEIKHHCEYALFEKIFKDIDRERMIGGTLYVTLEPCNERGLWKNEKGEELPKIPCAVRCVEAGISKIYIGTHDPDDTAKWKGATTIKTGKYSFNVDDKGNPTDGNIEAAKALMKVFDDKSYPYIIEGRKKTYTIGNSIGKDNVRLFHPDLSLEIIQLNKEFLKGKEENAFVSFDMPG